ncbi:11897_t:CDS:2 [Rhizophagus irregularis]|nr:11897_t:CDS:2 [Rhizophagus irregularis]
MVTIFTFNATTHIPTDPQVLAVYNGLNRAQRATYDTLATDRERSIFLNGIAEERRKSRHYLNLIHAVINLLSVIGFNIVLQVSKRDIYHRSSHYWGSVGGSGRTNLDVAKYRDFFCRSWDIVCRKCYVLF